MTQQPTRDMNVEVRDKARQQEPDRYLAALLSPARVRNDLIALAAFGGEIRRIAVLVRDPHLAEIRLTWWRDALAQPYERSGNPVADAFAEAVVRHRLPREEIEAWLEAFAHTLYAASPQDDAHLCLEHELIEGTAFVLAARIAGSTMNGHSIAACKQAGVAYGLARLGLELPLSLSRGRVPLPGLLSEDESLGDIDQDRAVATISGLARENLARVARSYAQLDQQTRAALVPLALVEPYLRALQRSRRTGLTRTIGDVAPMRRVWSIWLAHVTGRV